MTGTDTERPTARVPMWVATAAVIMVALVPYFFFGQWKFTLWVGFVVWAEYFALGGKPGNARTIFPCFLAGSANACVYILLSVWLEHVLGGGSGMSYLAWCIGTVVTTPALILPLQKFGLIQRGSLPYFNGFAMVFALFFAGSAGFFNPEAGQILPAIGPANVYWCIVLAFLWANLMAVFGWLIGFLNVAFTLPRHPAAPAEPKPVEAARTA